MRKTVLVDELRDCTDAQANTPQHEIDIPVSEEPTQRAKNCEEVSLAALTLTVVALMQLVHVAAIQTVLKLAPCA